MNKKVLITYISQSGSTREIAQAIQKTLNHKQVESILLEVKNVKNIKQYQAVVLGLPLYMFRWPAAGMRFLNRHKQQILAGLPVALFTGGPTEKGDDNEWKTIHEQIQKELARIPWFEPVALKAVGGKIDPVNLAFPWKLIPAMKNIPVNDLRDWDDIRQWAASLPALFQLQQTAIQKEGSPV
ncbi:MAG: hypothetical protein JEZ00_21530 [Anaerolineaceae bacterium]|nr:hypothetical protein [Anaerolineaceae bacterium]